MSSCAKLNGAVCHGVLATSQQTSRPVMLARSSSKCRVTSARVASTFVGKNAAFQVTRSQRKYQVGARSPLTVLATIDVGDKIPDGTLSYFDSKGDMQSLSVEEMCAGKKVVLFAVPGAFTPTCSLKHLPGFIKEADNIKTKGVDTIGCIAVNDAFVMDAWGKHVNAGGKVMMLADGSAQFTKALGTDLDLTDKGLGIRSRRYSMLIDDGVVKTLNLEQGGAFTISGAEAILEALEEP